MNKALAVLATLLCASLAVPAAAAQDDSPMARAFAAIAAGHNDEARPLIERHLAEHPDDAQAWHQLAYVDEALKDYACALTAVERYLSLAPSDERARLERAYDLANAGRADDATRQFALLRSSEDPEIAKQATAEWKVRQPQPALHTQGIDVFGYAVNESRFADSFFGVDARKSLGRGGVQPYAVVHLVGDLRSGSGKNAQIFSDNAAITDVGARARIASGTYLFAEGGLGFGLRGQGTVTDARYGLASSQQWGTLHDGLSLDASIATYSRYAGNSIAYLDLRKTIPLSRSVSLLVGADAGADAQRLYYNNFAQAVAGIQLGTPSMKLRLETVQGRYLTRGLARPAKTTYSSFRPVLLFGFSR